MAPETTANPVGGRSTKRLVLVLSVFLNALFLILLFLNSSLHSSSSSPIELNAPEKDRLLLAADDQVVEWPEHPKVIYAHVHIAKTAGTEINGELALKYERVCGYKGYSYDAFQFNNKAEKWLANHPGKLLRADTLRDSFSKVQSRHNRGYVPNKAITEIGFQNCDWISDEQPFRYYMKELQRDLGNTHLELHVPCREPISFLMSMCNFNGQQKFACDHDKVKQNVDKCLVFMDRFEDSQASLPPNSTLKCFNPIPIDPYLEYMRGRLQPRRFTRPYVHRDTNLPRDKTKECIWKDEKMQELVKEYLLNFPIFRFCKECVGSENDLFPSLDAE